MPKPIDPNDWMGRPLVPRRRVADDILGQLTNQESKERYYNELGRQARSGLSRQYAGGALFGSLLSGILSGSQGGTEAAFMSAMPGVTAASGFIGKQANEQLLAERRTEGSLNRYLSALIRGATLDTANERNDLMAYNAETDRMKAYNEANSKNAETERKKVAEYVGKDGKQHVVYSDGKDEVYGAVQVKPEKEDELTRYQKEMVKQKGIADLAEVEKEIQKRVAKAQELVQPTPQEQAAMQQAATAKTPQEKAAIEAIAKTFRDKREAELKTIRQERDELYRRQNMLQELHGFEVTPNWFTKKTYRGGKPTGGAPAGTSGFSGKVQRGKGF